MYTPEGNAMFNLFRCLFATAFLGFYGDSYAEESVSQPIREPAVAVAPFLREQTFLIVRVDLERLAVDPIVGLAAKLFGEVAIYERENRLKLAATRQRLLSAGAKEVFIIVDAVDFRRDGPTFLLAPGDRVDPTALVGTFGKLYKYRKKRGQFFVVATAVGGKRLEQLRPEKRQGLSEAFAAAGRSPVQAVLLPPAYARRVIEELLPELPKALGGGPSKLVTRSLLWVCLAADTSPELKVRVVVKASDADGARELAKVWDRALAAWLGPEAVRGRASKVNRIRDLLRPKLDGQRLVLTLSSRDGSLTALFQVLSPIVESRRKRLLRYVSINNLKQIGLAIHNYYSAIDSLPPPVVRDKKGAALYSWRVKILPYIGMKDAIQIYNEFHLDEPWDSPHNRKLIPKMPAVFRSPASKLPRESGLATYRVVSGKETVFPPDKAVKFKEITDGTSTTLLIVEVNDKHAVIWTKPEPLPFDMKILKQALGGQFPGGFHAAFCDGSVRLIPDTIEEKHLRALFTRSGGELVPREALEPQQR